MEKRGSISLAKMTVTGTVSKAKSLMFLLANVVLCVDTKVTRKRSTVPSKEPEVQKMPLDGKFSSQYKSNGISTRKGHVRHVGPSDGAVSPD